MPTYHGFRLDDRYGVQDARTATIEPNEQSAVDPTQMQCPTYSVLLKHIELMPQNQDFSFQAAVVA
jgi:hypothetical protein